MKFKTRNIDYRDLYLDELPVRNESDYTQSREEVLDSVKRIVEEYGFRDYFYENKYKIGPVDIEFRLDATNHDKAGLYLVVESRTPIGTRNFNQEIGYTDKYIKPTVKAIMDCYNGKG